MKWHYSSSHLPDSSHWATNTSLFRFFINIGMYTYVCIYIRWCWLDGGLLHHWSPAAAPVSSSQTSVLPALLRDCQEVWISPLSSCSLGPQGPGGPAIVWQWHILTNTLMHFCHSDICIDVTGKIMQWDLSRAGKVLPTALWSFCLPSAV